MAPRWFKNIRFGNDLTNAPTVDRILSNFKTNIEERIGDFGFDSTIDEGPIIEEILPEICSSPPGREPSSSPSPSPARDPSPSPSLAPEPSPSSSPSLSASLAHEPSPQASPARGPSPSLSASLARGQSPSPSPSPSPQASLAREPSPQASPAREPSPLPPPSSSPCASPGLPRRKRMKRLDFARGERPIYKRNSSGTYDLVDIHSGHPKTLPNFWKRNQERKQFVKPPEFKDSSKGTFQYHLEKFGPAVLGSIRLAPGCSKPVTKCSRHNRYIFIVRGGQASITINKKTYHANSNSGWIQTQPGDCYKIQNCGRRNAEIAYLVVEEEK